MRLLCALLTVLPTAAVAHQEAISHAHPHGIEGIFIALVLAVGAAVFIRRGRGR